jgi:elongation factor 1-gamma
VLIAARLGGSSLTHVEDAPPRDKFPLGLTPAFDGNGVLLFGAESIALHVGGPAMLAGQKIEEVVQWLQWSEAQLLPNVLAYVLPCVSVAQLDKKSVDENRLELQAQLSHLNSLLLSRTFLVGERLSLADISVALDLLPAFQHVLDASARAQIGNVNRWLLTVLNQTHVKAVVGDVKFAEHVAQFDGEESTVLFSGMRERR